MASNLKKFVNPKFLKTCNLPLMRRLMARSAKKPTGFDLSVLDGNEDTARKALRQFFEGPESAYPEGLTADLHRIAALGESQGMRLLLERAKAAHVLIGPKPGSKEDAKADPKYIALLCFLDHKNVFDAASDFLALETTVGLTELRGHSADTVPTIDRTTKAAFESAAHRFLSTEHMGGYCRVSWYEDGDDINVVTVHGREIATEWIVENEKSERVISFRPLSTTVLCYDPFEGRLKIGGLPKAQRAEFASIFAGTMLRRPEFFADEDAQDLYSLEAVEKAGFAFRFDHAYDPGIRGVVVFEAEAERMVMNGPSESRLWSVVVKDRRNALERMGQTTRIGFGDGAYRLGYICFRIEFESDTGRRPRVTVKLAPPGIAAFKRETHEGRIMTLLQRNGLCVDRDTGNATVAAE